MVKRRTFTPEFKAKRVLEELSGTKTAADICREHQLKPQVFTRWRSAFLERAP
jgi:transposase-like protein